MNRFVRRVNNRPLKMTNSRNTGCQTILNEGCGRRHNCWYGVRKKDQIGCHITTKSATGYKTIPQITLHPQLDSKTVSTKTIYICI